MMVAIFRDRLGQICEVGSAWILESRWLLFFPIILVSETRFSFEQIKKLLVVGCNSVQFKAIRLDSVLFTDPTLLFQVLSVALIHSLEMHNSQTYESLNHQLCLQFPSKICILIRCYPFSGTPHLFSLE
jgi:hypothetical protein